MNLKLLTLGLLLTAPAFADQSYSEVSKSFAKDSNNSIEQTTFGTRNEPLLKFHLLNQLNRDEDELAPTLIANVGVKNSQNLWKWNPEKLLVGKNNKDLLDVIHDFYSMQIYLRSSARNSRPYPYLNTWGQLFHPPVHALTLSPKDVFTPFTEPNPVRNRSFLAPDVQAHFDILTGHELTAGNKTTLLENKDSFEEKLSLVKNAKESILISQLALACDASSIPMIEALSAAKKRNVDVRILIDHLYALIAKSCIQKFIDLGINVSVVQNPNSKLKILATTNHTSMWIIDSGTLIIGAQNLADANNTSTGYNFKDRDTDLKIQGPIATDALREYIDVWNENRTTKDISMMRYTLNIRQKLREERSAGLRGPENYSKWSNQSKGLCRIAFQRPNRKETGLSSLLIEAIRLARKSIQITTTQAKTGDTGDLINSMIRILTEKSKQTSTRIDLIGNGIDGGDGELTMALDEMTQKQIQKGNWRTAGTLDYLSDSDALKKALANHDALLALNNPLFKTYQYFNFYHGKQWYFDRTALVIGSMNFDAESFQSHYEGAVMCLDSDLNSRFEESLLLDLVNSVPVVN